MSKIEVDQLDPQSGTELTIGSSGDTIKTGGNLDTNDNNIVTASNRDLNLYPNGTGAVEIGGNTNPGTIILNCEQNSHGIKLQSPPHSANQSYTLKFPSGNVTAGKFLKVDSVSGSGTTGVGTMTFADAGGGSLTLLKTLTASNVSQLNIQNGSDGVVIDDTYDVYILKASRVYGATNDVRLQLRMKYGSTTETSSYRSASLGVHYNGSTTTSATDSTTSYMMRSRDNIRNNYPEYFNASFEFYSLGKASSRVSMTYTEFFRKDSSGYSFTSDGFGHVDSNQTWDGMEFEMSSGNIYGIFSLYGVKKA